MSYVLNSHIIQTAWECKNISHNPWCKPQFNTHKGLLHIFKKIYTVCVVGSSRSWWAYSRKIRNRQQSRSGPWKKDRFAIESSSYKRKLVSKLELIFIISYKRKLGNRPLVCTGSTVPHSTTSHPVTAYHSQYIWSADCVWNVMAHAQKTDFVFRRNGRVHLNRRGRQFSRLLAAEVCASAVVILDTPCSEVVWRVQATHSIR